MTWLQNTPDYSNDAAKSRLAQRVVNLFKNMSEDEDLRDLAVEKIESGLTSCDERVAHSMDDLEILLKVHLAQKSESEDKLRALGNILLPISGQGNFMKKI